MFDAYNRQKEIMKEMDERKKVNDIKNLKKVKEDYEDLKLDEEIYYYLDEIGSALETFDEAFSLASSRSASMSDLVLHEYFTRCNNSEFVKLLAVNALSHNIDPNNFENIFLFLYDRLEFNGEGFRYLYGDGEALWAKDDSEQREKIKEISIKVQKKMKKMENIKLDADIDDLEALVDSKNNGKKL